MTQTITLDTAKSMDSLSYYSLCRLADITGFSNPVAGIPANGEVWTATMDSLGNLLTAKKEA